MSLRRSIFLVLVATVLATVALEVVLDVAVDVRDNGPGIPADQLEHLFQELAEDRNEKARLIERCGLDAVLWAQLRSLARRSPPKWSRRGAMVRGWRSWWRRTACSSTSSTCR